MLAICNNYRNIYLIFIKPRQRLEKDSQSRDYSYKGGWQSTVNFQWSVITSYLKPKLSVQRSYFYMKNLVEL